MQQSLEAHTNRALINRSRLVVVVADSSKIGRVGFARICELSRIDEIITDTAAEALVLRTMEEVGVRVTIV